MTHDHEPKCNPDSSVTCKICNVLLRDKSNNNLN